MISNFKYNIKILSKFCVLLILFSYFHAEIKAQTFDEYTLKSIWLEKFSRYINWPENTVYQNNEFVIGVLGENPFNDLFSVRYSQKPIFVNNKLVVVKYFDDFNKINNCQILFISKDHKRNIKKIIEIFKKKPVLLVADFDDFAKNGGCLNFCFAESKLVFEINETALVSAGLKITYELRQVVWHIYDPIIPGHY